MGYRIHVWQQPADRPPPKTAAQASALVAELKAQSPGQNPKFIELVHSITSRWPNEGQMDGKTDSGVLTIGVVDPYQVMSILILTARHMGLNVEDPQKRMFYLADGTSLSAAEEWLKALAADLLEKACQRLAPFFRDHGFTRQPDEPRSADSTWATRRFRKSYPTGWHELEVMAGGSGIPKAGVNLQSNFAPVSNLMARIEHDGILPKDAHQLVTTFIRPKRWLRDLRVRTDSDGYYEVSKPEDLDRAMDHLNTQLEQRLMPILGQYQSIAGFDTLMNGGPVAESMFFDGYEFSTYHLLGAFLAQNPRLGAMCQEFLDGVRPDHRGFSAPYEKFMRKVVDYVRMNRFGR